MTQEIIGLVCLTSYLPEDTTEKEILYAQQQCWAYVLLDENGLLAVGDTCPSWVELDATQFMKYRNYYNLGLDPIKIYKEQIK